MIIYLFILRHCCQLTFYQLVIVHLVQKLFFYLPSIVLTGLGDNGRIPTIQEHMELKTTICQPTSKSESSIRTPRQIYCTELKRGAVSQPLSKHTSIDKQLSTQNTQLVLTGYHQE
ncbi:unnamed protein product [Schistosoma mattheei]|uniref:Uncharacterized protein n=1 Tax=Schistosoma mattheei TaxID=31246 RepID=A0AA85BJM4_9TREM|nr:unnamed protein product [Schistosoma mattheei]